MISDFISLHRRRVINIFGSAAAIAFSVSGLMEVLESNQVAVEEVPLSIDNLPDSLIGTRFAQISDLHMGPDFKSEDLFPVIEKINELEPEFLMITGDYVNDENSRIHDMLAPLQALTVPAYGILGNHDAWGHVWSIERVLGQASVELLWNQAVEVKPHLWLIGLDDVLLGRPNLRRALADTRTGETNLLMVHEPDYFIKTVESGAPIAAQFSGHTHGGQVRLPTLRRTSGAERMQPYILPSMGKQYVMGLYEVRHQTLYVNRGLGFTGPPLRLNCQPEISIFTLT